MALNLEAETQNCVSDSVYILTQENLLEQKSDNLIFSSFPTQAAINNITEISVLSGHISCFSENRDADKKAPANRAASGFTHKKLYSISEFASSIKTGASWSNSIYKNGQRKQENVEFSTTLTVEFDDVVPGVNDYRTIAPKSGAFAAIPSPSHYTGNLKHKPGGYRLVYRLSRKVNGGELKAITSEVMRGLKCDDIVIDTACKDVARFWYGAKDADLLWQSQENWDNPLDADQILSDRAQKSGISLLSPEGVRYLNGVDDGIPKLNPVDFYTLYQVSPPKEQAKLSRHEALQGIQQALTAQGLDKLAVQIRQAVRGDSEGIAESERNIDNSRSHIDNRAKNGQPYELLKIKDFSDSNNSNGNHRNSKKSILIDEIEHYEPITESKSDFNWDLVKESLPSDLRGAIKMQHRILGTPYHTLLLACLTVLTTDLSGKAVVRVNPASNWYEPLILWTAIVGVAGSAKTPMLKQVTHHLSKLNEKYANTYECNKDEYDYAQILGDTSVSMPVKRYASLGQVTTERMIAAVHTNSKHYDTGFLISLDELASLLGAFNKRGGSDDTSVYLNAWNGGEINKSTITGGDFYAARGCVSILGGIQDNVWTKYLQNLAGRNDDNGFAGRWLVGYISREDRVNVQIGSNSERSTLPSVIECYLDGFSRSLSGIELTFANDIDAQSVQDFFQEKADTADNPNIWLKGKSNAFRIAGVLAMLNHSMNVEKLHLEAATNIVVESIRHSNNLLDKSDEKAIDTVMSRAKALALRNKKLDNRTLQKNRLGESIEERQQIILKLYETLGGTLEEARKGLRVWIPPTT
jgi:hypothetical protein